MLVLVGISACAGSTDRQALPSGSHERGGQLVGPAVWVEPYGCPGHLWRPGSRVELSHEATTVDVTGTVTDWHAVLCRDGGGNVVYQWDAFPVVADPATTARSG